MMKKLLFILFITFTSLSNLFADRGDYVADTLVDEFSQAVLDLVWSQIPDQISESLPCVDWNLPTQYPVEMYKLVYETVNTYGEPTIASGLLTIPVGYECNLPMAVYNHGTQNGGALSDPPGLPDLLAGNLGEWFISVPVATNGYIAIFPDYIGYGQSACTDFHPYNHRAQARDVVDMIRATKQFCDMNDIAYSNEIFMTGYSEGGYVAMATTREIQENHCDEMQVVASAPLSGAHSTYPLSRDSLLAPSYNNINNLTYYIYSHHNICPEILGEGGLSEAVLSPYAENISLAWNECDPQGTGPFEWTSPASGILNPDYVEAVTSDPCHPFNELLRKSNMNNWVPNMPMRLYYIVTDEQVPYTNSTTTAAWMAENGGDVEALTVPACAEDSINHSSFAIPSLLATMEWFETLRSTECDYVAELDPSLCGEAPEPNSLCPEEGVFTPYNNFTIDGDEITFETIIDTTCLDNSVTVIDTIYVTDTVEVVIIDTVEVIIVDTVEVVTVDTVTVIDTVEVVTVDTVTIVDTLTVTVTDTIIETWEVGLEDLNAAQIALQILGNPVENNLLVNFQNANLEMEAEVFIYDMNGKTISRDQLFLQEETQYQKDISNLSMGMYFFQVQLIDGSNQTIRFIKN